MKTCNECKGKCCKVFGVQIPAPETPEDFDDIRWYFYHKPARVIIDNNDDWIIETPIKCSKLGKDGKCKIYSKRPSVCKSLELKDCPANINDEKFVFKTDTEYRKWLKKHHPDVENMIYEPEEKN